MAIRQPTQRNSNIPAAAGHMSLSTDGRSVATCSQLRPLQRMLHLLLCQRWTVFLYSRDKLMGEAVPATSSCWRKMRVSTID
jgi:hypothetical protein